MHREKKKHSIPLAIKSKVLSWQVTQPPLQCKRGGGGSVHVPRDCVRPYGRKRLLAEQSCIMDITFDQYTGGRSTMTHMEKTHNRVILSAEQSYLVDRTL